MKKLQRQSFHILLSSLILILVHSLSLKAQYSEKQIKDYLMGSDHKDWKTEYQGKSDVFAPSFRLYKSGEAQIIQSKNKNKQLVLKEAGNWKITKENGVWVTVMLATKYLIIPDLLGTPDQSMKFQVLTDENRGKGQLDYLYLKPYK